MIPLRRPFQPRPWDPDREDNRTEKQKAATERNFRVFRMRSLWALVYILPEPTRSTVQNLIDFELRQIGALPQREHESEQRRKRLARLHRERQRNATAEIEEDDIPF